MKRIAFRSSLLVLMVSVLITSFSLNSYAQHGPRPHDFKGDSARVEMGIPKLTPEQKTQIEGLKVKHLKEVTPLRNELAEKKAHLNTLVSAEKVDRDAINKTVDEISVLQGKIMKMKVNHRLDVASTLTDEQKVFFNAHQEQGGKGHMGMGREMKKEMKKEKGSNCPMNK